jgi:hypothetical protein
MALSRTGRPARGLTDEALTYARQRYEETDESQASIAADLGTNYAALRRLAIQHGWQLRRNRAPRDLSDALRLKMAATQALAETEAAVAEVHPPPHGNASVEANDDPSDPGATDLLPARLEAAVEKELRKVEALRHECNTAAGRTSEAERTARTLATLTETLFKVRRLREPLQSGQVIDDDMPADIDGFRRALAERMDMFVRSRTDRALPADGGDTNAAPA